MHKLGAHNPSFSTVLVVLSDIAEAIATDAADHCFAHQLLAWWDVHGRKDLPWQWDRSPYRVWVAEVMLQQTQVSTAAPYFERFNERFPDVHALASAPLDDVLHVWSGLGYYARARNLHRAAVIVVRECGGIFPSDQQALMALPGIGRSTAAAIVAQAYDRPAAILDANVKRVLARQHRVGGAATAAATVKALWQLAERHTPPERAADYTQAIMDLGAMVCLPGQPRCTACPVSASCQARAANEMARYPERAERRQRPMRRRRFFVLTDASGASFVERRPASGIWGGLWSPPERDAELSVEEFLAAFGIGERDVREVHVAPAIRHAFTHYTLDAIPVYVRLKAHWKRTPEVREGGGAWIDPANHRLGLSVVAAKLLDATREIELDGADS